MRSVFEFENYRDFLRDYYLERKARGYSFTRFARSLGLKSRSHLRLIIGGRRNLTVELIHSTARVIGLAGNYLEYYEALVLANQAKTPGVREYYSLRMKSIKVRMSND